ncbi:serine/threonine protein kinase [Desulfonatronum parangueonense]
MAIPELNGWSHDPDARLGGGGYAQVYRGSHPDNPEQAVAVKIFDNPLHANTFEQEVRVLQALHGCPHIPALLAFGRDETGRLCIITEMASGIRLDRYIRHHGVLSTAKATILLEQVLAVLAYAHQRDILHKDIKASNILMDGDVFTVLDWGVAQFRNIGRQETIRAKQDYVAPECYWGRQEFSTDFYSLGWLVIQALSGELPYRFAQDKDRDYRMAAHCLERPELPECLEKPLRNLVANWLRKDPSQRLVGYHLPTLLAQARTSPSDFLQYLEYRQIRHESSFLHQGARHGVPYAQYHLALRLLQAQRLREARYWLEQAADQSYARARYRLSRLLAQTDPGRAAGLLEQAAAAGHGPAQYHLGSSLLSSRDTPADVARGLSFLRQAADNGHGPSNAYLATWLAHSPKHLKEAWLRRRRAQDRGQTVKALQVIPRQKKM